MRSLPGKWIGSEPRSRQRELMKRNDDQYRWRVRMLALHGAMLVGPAVLLFAHSRWPAKRYGACVFKAAFGVDCPACGITRSAMAMFTGNIFLAIRLHPAGPLVVAVISVMTAYLAIVVCTSVNGLEWGKEVKAYKGTEMLALAALLIGWFGRIVVY